MRSLRENLLEKGCPHGTASGKTDCSQPSAPDKNTKVAVFRPAIPSSAAQPPSGNRCARQALPLEAVLIEFSNTPV